MDIKDKSLEFQKGYIYHNDELIKIWNNAVKYDLSFNTLIVMLNDFIKESIDTVNETENFTYKW